MSAASKTKKIFISFNYDDDKDYRYLLSALNENSDSDIEFVDSTPSEIDSDDIGRIKATLTRKIREDSEYTLVLIGSGANEEHEDHEKIGSRNWQWWEIEQADEEGHKFVAVRLSPGNASPEPLLGKSGTQWVNSYKVDSIVQAIKEV